MRYLAHITAVLVASCAAIEVAPVWAEPLQAPSGPLTQAAPAPGSSPGEAEQMWGSLKDSQSIEAIEAFRQRYGSAHAILNHLALERIEALKDAAAKGKTAVVPPVVETAALKDQSSAPVHPAGLVEPEPAAPERGACAPGAPCTEKVWFFTEPLKGSTPPDTLSAKKQAPTPSEGATEASAKGQCYLKGTHPAAAAIAGPCGGAAVAPERPQAPARVAKTYSPPPAPVTSSRSGPCFLKGTHPAAAAIAGPC